MGSAVFVYTDGLVIAPGRVADTAFAIYNDSSRLPRVQIASVVVLAAPTDRAPAVSLAHSHHTLVGRGRYRNSSRRHSRSDSTRYTTLPRAGRRRCRIRGLRGRSRDLNSDWYYIAVCFRGVWAETPAGRTGPGLRNPGETPLRALGVLAVLLGPLPGQLPGVPIGGPGALVIGVQEVEHVVAGVNAVDSHQ